MSTKVLSEKTVLTADFFKINEVNLELKDGSKRTYLQGRRDPSISVIPMDKNGDIYLIKEYRYMYKKYLLQTVGGMVEHGLSALDTAKKELQEEAGITATDWLELGKYQAASSILTWETRLFLAKGLSMVKRDLEEAEEISVVKLPLQEAIEKVLTGEINTAAAVTNILWVDKLRQSGKI